MILNPSWTRQLRRNTHYLVYFGTYTVDEEDPSVTHHVEGSIVPSYTKTDQVRPYVLDGDRLELGDGKTWRRVIERVR
jgi:Lipocalin-like domain